jgi:hypothetical protein
LLALPLFFVAEAVIDHRTHRAVLLLARGGFLSQRNAHQLDRVVANAERLRSSVLIEAALLAFVLVGGVTTLVHGPTGVPLWNHGQLEGLSPPVIYYRMVALPLFQFVMARILWRWVVWIRLLFGVAIMRLELEPNHPDRCGGLAPLGEPAVGFGVWLMAVSIVLASTWGGEMIRGVATLKDFEALFVSFAIAGLALAIGPSLLLLPQLRLWRDRGWLRYSEFSLQYTRAFRRRWLRVLPPEAPLGTQDIQALSDLDNSYGVVDKMRFVPFRQEILFYLVAMMAIPMLPLLLSAMSLADLLQRVGGIVLGGRG